jgi:Mitochondrial carrier protein
MQTMGSSGKSIAGVIKLTLAESGFRSLYTGLSASLLRQMSYSLVRIGSYEKTKRWLAKGTHSIYLFSQLFLSQQEVSRVHSICSSLEALLER